MKSLSLVLGAAAAKLVQIFDDDEATLTADWSIQGDNLVLMQTLTPKNNEFFADKFIFANLDVILSTEE